MGILGSIGGILKKAAPIIGAIGAAPFTGGASLGTLPMILGAAGAAAPILGGLAAGRAQGKQSEADISLRNQQLRQQLLDMMSRNASEGAKFELDAPSTRFGQGIRGNLAANLQDVSVSHPRANVAHFSGGLRPSALGQGGRDLGSQLAALAAERMGKDKIAFPAAPPEAELPKSGLLDKILGIAGIGTSLLGAFAPGGTTSASSPSIRDMGAVNPQDLPGFNPLDEYLRRTRAPL